MKNIYVKADLSYTLDSITELINMKDNDYFVETIYKYYPSISKEELFKLNSREREEYIKNKFTTIFREKQYEIDMKILEYQKFWDNNETVLISKLEDIFSISLKDCLNNIVSRVRLDSICPRFLEDNTFDIFYSLTPKQSFESSVHEIVHFIWFKIWHEHFNDDYSEYECPNLKWIFSEIAISPILLDDRMKDLISLEKPAYNYFYNITIDGENLMNKINEIYKNNDLLAFMNRGFNLCRSYEKQIRNCMY